MRAYMHARKASGGGSPSYDSDSGGRLRARRDDALRGQLVTVSNEQKAPGDASHGGSLVIADGSGKTFSLPCDMVSGEAFVLDMDGLSLEVACEPKGGPMSIMLYAPNDLLDMDKVQDAYNLAYDVADECKAMGGSAEVRERVGQNRFFLADDDGGGVDDGIVVPQSQQADDPIADALLGGGDMTYASNGGRRAMDTNQYGGMQPQQAPSYDWAGIGGIQPDAQQYGGSGGSADFDQLRSMMNQFIDKVSVNTDNRQKEIDDLNAKLTQQLLRNEKVNKEYIKAQHDNDTLRDRISEYEEQVADKERAITDLQKTIAASVESHEALKQELDATKAKLEQSKKDAQGRLDTANAAVNAVHQQLMSSQQQVKALNDTIRAKDEQAQKDADSISGLRDQLRTERTKSSKLSSDIVAARDAASAEQSKLKAQYEQRISAQQADLQKARQSAKDTEARATKSLHDLSEKTMSHIKEQQDAFNAERDHLKQQISDLTTLLDSVTNDRDSLRSQIALVSRSMSTAKDKLRSTETQVKDLQSELDDANKRCEAANKRNERLSEQLDEAQQAADVARTNADNTTRYAAQKYAEAIRQRDTCEGTLSAMRDAMRSHGVDPAIIAIVDQSISDIIGSKGNDNPMLLAAATQDDTDDVFNVNGSYMSSAEIDSAADEVAGQYGATIPADAGEQPEDDATGDAHGDAEEADAEYASDTADDGVTDAADGTDDDDDDFSFPVDGGDEDYDDGDDADDDDQIIVPERAQGAPTDGISDTDLAGTPLSGTGVIDSDQIESMLEDEDFDASGETDGE